MALLVDPTRYLNLCLAEKSKFSNNQVLSYFKFLLDSLKKQFDKT